MPSPSCSGSQSPARPAVLTFPVKSQKKSVGNRKPSGRPTVVNMIVAAIGVLKDKKGSSVQAIKSYIMATYPGIPLTLLPSLLKRGFHKGLQTGALVRPKGSLANGASGRFRVGAVSTKKPAKKAKKTAGKKKSAGKGKARRRSTGKAKKARKPARKSATKKRPKKMLKKAIKKARPSKRPTKKIVKPGSKKVKISKRASVR
ncbi:sperm-specific H1/protamine-like protein type 2 [Haliotis rufescens]|uniref:sperm-specific H1/protamine-like protein type 2 n=1 Tax=Haliotis rufescens TaxID=6454 RepID=UPI001EAFB82A|nr:sperm-specific H1/protamine-like protein type 2 [Haliotis rufescens]